MDDCCDGRKYVLFGEGVQLSVRMGIGGEKLRFEREVARNAIGECVAMEVCTSAA